MVLQVPHHMVHQEEARASKEETRVHMELLEEESIIMGLLRRAAEQRPSPRTTVVES